VADLVAVMSGSGFRGILVPDLLSILHDVWRWADGVA